MMRTSDRTDKRASLPNHHRLAPAFASSRLHPIIRDEAYRIGREALVNAFRHAQAGKIDVELEYAAKSLRIVVRDDGTGIDAQVLESGKDGHWGLSGMRERAESIGARLRVWSRINTGTEVELSIPAHIAFAPQKETT